jgi:hypothetical protein
MVHVAHPPALFALALLDGTHLACPLQRATLAVELTAFEALIAAIPEEARAFANDMHHSRDLDAQVNPHNGRARRELGLWQREGNIGNPFAALAGDTQQIPATGLRASPL